MFQRTKICAGLLIGFGGLYTALPALAQDDQQSVQRVEITGSSIKRIDAELAELAIEEAVIGASAKFAVRDGFEAELFLQPNGVANGRVFLRPQCGVIDFGTGETAPLSQEFRRAQ